MKKNYFLLMFFSLVCNSLFAQPYVYAFNNSLVGSGGGPTLTEVLTCSASAGAFNSQAITLSSGTCGNQTAFDFNAGDGFTFDNSSSLIGDTYTIHMLFKFNAIPAGPPSPSGAQRVIDFQGGTNDNGIYNLPSPSCLDFYPLGTTVGTCPNQTAGTFTLFTLVRDGTDDSAFIYIDGNLFEKYLDNSKIYVPTTPTTPITFFIDNTTGSYQCENGAGSIRYLSLSPTTSTPAEVASTWGTMCSILPLDLLDFHANQQNKSVVLSWTTASEVNTSHFELERSSDGSNFVRLADIPTHNNSSTNTYNYVDNQPLSTGFYRLKLVDLDGNFKYSGIVKIDFTGIQKFEAFPNPANNVITISGVNNNEVVRLLSSDGKLLMQKRASGQSMTMDISAYSSGLYILQYFDGTNMQNLKLVKE